MLVLDTDLVTIVQRREGSAYRCLHPRLEAAARIQRIGITIVSFEEQARGWLSFLSGAKTLERKVDGYSRLAAMLQDYCAREILKFDALAAREFEVLRKSKIRVGTMDLKIAAIVLSRGATLLSRNLGDFRKVPSLTVEDWTKE